MKKHLPVFSLAIITIVGVASLLSNRALAQQPTDVPGISDSAMQQIAEILALKRALAPGESKLDSQLLFGAKVASGEVAATSAAGAGAATDVTSATNVTVDIYGTVSDGLLGAIASANGTVLDQSPQAGMLRASLPLGAVATVAANGDVKSIQSSALFMTNVGALTSQGYISHAANKAVGVGINGTGVTVGVLSDSASPARVAALIATGDLPTGTTSLPGQDGPAGSTDEGAAMMEIVHDVAPGANLIFATADNGVANFAANIVALKNAGAKVIVDDVTYFNEGAFQDGPIARAVNQVTAAGVTYFSSAANSGNLTLGTSGTFEGDFLSGGAVSGPVAALGEPGFVHNFGTSASPQNFDVLTATSSVINLKWSDPLGASANDYDLFILNSTGTTVKAFSAAAQSGTQDPYEAIFQGTGCGTATPSGYCPAAGDRIVVVLFSGSTRALRVDTNRGRLSIATAGSTFGHNAGVSTVSMAATYWNSAHTGTKAFVGSTNPIETFSSDGPRKIFFNPNGTAITPGNVLFGTNGGTTLQKPDFAAADGTSAKTPGFNPFFGTSAAAPHAAGIAALILQVQPSWTPAQVVNALKSTALDSMAPGTDRDSGFGIAMAYPAVQYAQTH